ncbi:metal ABC transporter ATP-binding protein [Kurthia sibirica]|uniref:Manganese transporter n=1 Tax=Kurthia sibirica TaxID=202750 RepID=A0A2U3APD5_9BACL|nr:metal ABC transporter ATP-binding protein [Kurthia sibirica]PWI26397.1 manganese transporter [Kurthia sibirica]GEK34166.1 manganese transporter [Kurthia sibirica]
MNTICVENLSVSYVGHQVVKNVSFQFSQSALIGILGPNGAGKSTMIKGLLGLMPATYTALTLGGTTLKMNRRQVAYVPQRSDLDFDFPIIVRDVVLLGTYPNLGIIRRPGKKEYALAAQCLGKVGMSDFATRQIGELSGGQQQRVFLARALAQQAQYLFLDEPFVGIDGASETIMIKILRELRDEGKIIFVVHHDLSKVESYFDQLILLNQEVIAAGDIKDVFTNELLQKAYKSPLVTIANRIGGQIL